MRRSEPVIIAETEDYIAVSKPSGMLTLPDRHDEELQSLRGWMQSKFGKVWVIHRLDKDTSGLIIFGKNEAAHKYFSQLFENRQVQKIYHGLVVGKPLQPAGTIDAPIAENSAKNGTMLIHQRGKASLTEYKILQSWAKFSLVEFDLKTGRTHQIRVHSRFIDHPIACDPIYGDGKPVLLSEIKKRFNLAKKDETENPLLNRLALHSYSLSFTDRNGASVQLVAPHPKDLHALMQQLDKHSK